MKKGKVILLSISLLFPVYMFSQQKVEVINIKEPETKREEVMKAEESETNDIFIYVKNMPEFPGGVIALKRYIAKHISYPASARENGIEGTVFIRFEITKSGKIGKTELQKGIDPLLDREAIRVIKTLPDFIPGMQGGKRVNVWYSVPVNFKLN